MTSIGPQTGPRQGVVLTGGAIINPTITVIDAATDTVIAHVALDIHAARPLLVHRSRAHGARRCARPALRHLPGKRHGRRPRHGRSGRRPSRPRAPSCRCRCRSTFAVPTLSLPPAVGAFGAKVCAAFTSTPGAACTSDADCGGCPLLGRGAAGRLLRHQQSDRPAQRTARHRPLRRHATRSTW